MATIDSVKLPNNSTYDLTDNYSGYQTENLATPLTINGTQETTVEGALGGLNDYGDALADNLAANEESGAKNLNVYPYTDTTRTENGITWTDNGDGTVKATGGTSGTYARFELHSASERMYLPNGTYKISGCPTGASETTYSMFLSYTKDGSTVGIACRESEIEFTIDGSDGDLTGASVRMGLDIESNVTLPIGGIVFKPMIRDARVIDPTFVPYAETNLQLTQNKAERNDLATIHATGSTNTTGAQIDAGTFFYLNGQFCKALTNIAVNATFTLNTNFKVDSVGEEIKAVENKDTSSFSVSTESGVSLQKAICRNGFVYLQLYFAALANSTKIATITDANYLPESGNAVGLIEPNLSAEKINYPYGSFSGSNVYVYVSGSPTSGGIITFVYPVTGY